MRLPFLPTFNEPMRKSLQDRIVRKSKKFFRDPPQFFWDMLRNRKANLTDLHYRVYGFRSHRRYSVISAVYGVEDYLEDFFRSLERQTLSFEKHIEVIMVDDGSLDGSAEIIKRWQRKYPSAIHYIRKENGGQASARNAGIPHATGDWVIFIDPDDFIDDRYFEYVDRFLNEQDEDEIAAVSTNFIVYDESTGKKEDRHPLRYRFAQGNRLVPIRNLHNDMQLTVNSVCFRRDILEKNKIRFDERIRPAFEDAHYANRYLLFAMSYNIAFLADAKYYYRKRSDRSSTLDLSWNHIGRYTDVFRWGYLDLMKTSASLSLNGKPHQWIQRTVLYDIVWIVKRLLSTPKTIDFLSDEQKSEFRSLIQESVELIDDQVIIDFSQAGAWLFHKIGIMNLFLNRTPSFRHIYSTHWDETNRLLGLRYFVSNEDEEYSFYLDAKETFPAYAKTVTHRFMESVFVREKFIWLYIPEESERLQAEVEGYEARFSIRGRPERADVDINDRIKRMVATPDLSSLSPFARIEYELATSARVATLYRDAFIFMDRDTQADDNAEHLYRYVREKHPEINAFFAINRDSHDWERLRAEGFRLLAFGSLRYRLALLNAKHLISSHADDYVVSHPSPELNGFLRPKVSFLQHGITKDDLSSWLNAKNISFLVAASKPEYDAFVSETFGYKFTDKEVGLSGFPRHDRLIAAPREEKRLLLIMPTWRQSLAGPRLGRGNSREKNDNFQNSEFTRRWKAFLHSDGLRTFANEFGYQIVFFPHANLEIYLDLFNVPSYIELMRHNSNQSIQSLFTSASLLVTDYSSVAFEMAYLMKPTIYYQFDRDEIFSGAHLYRKGYFDYHSDGFGPVCEEMEGLLIELRKALDPAIGVDEVYRERMKNTFPHRDGKCCERTFNAILALDEPRRQLNDARAMAARLVQAAQDATQKQKWTIAARRWESVMELPVEFQPSDSVYALLEALRELGKVDEGATLLQSLPLPTAPELLLRHRYEQAALATAIHAWEEAELFWQTLLSTSGLDERCRETAIALLAQCQRQLGKLDDALATLSLPTAEELKRSLLIREERALLAGARGDWATAAEQWESLCADYPNHASGPLEYAEALVQLGQGERASELIDTYMDASQDDSALQRARLLKIKALDLFSATDGSNAAS